MLVSPFSAVERESMEEDDSVPSIDPVDSFVPDSYLLDPTVYRQLVGLLMYLVNTRPNLCFVVSTLGQFMCEPR